MVNIWDSIMGRLADSSCYFWTDR